MDKTWNVKFNIQHFNIIFSKSFSKFCTFAILECVWCLPFGAKILRTITWRMALLTLAKAGHNLEVYDLKKAGNPDMYC